jgi:hypothetical protein
MSNNSNNNSSNSNSHSATNSTSLSITQQRHEYPRGGLFAHCAALKGMMDLEDNMKKLQKQMMMIKTTGEGKGTVTVKVINLNEAAVSSKTAASSVNIKNYKVYIPLEVANGSKQKQKH